ncbi:MAG TPA: sodium:proton antiporter, partial [Adhaeribacter sp.]|nr:sodium:proton antiporter [Adhaeribacter sp.]
MLFLSALAPEVPFYLLIPFLLLIGMIASGPVLFSHFWHKYYRAIAVALGLVMLVIYVFVRQDYHMTVETLADYASFAILLSSLYVAAGGIYINVNLNAKPSFNVTLLFIGAVLANVIGTTGASLLLIRPFIRVNVHRIKPYQIVFFIFIVSNAGGLLTPLGDPPLFIGFLKGVPFFWTLEHLIFPWILAVTALCLIFYLLDRRNKEVDFVPKPEVEKKNEEKTEFYFKGKRNLIWLAVILIAIFIDPKVIEGVPYIAFEGMKLSYIREILQLAAAFFCYRMASKTALNSNVFTFAPILEVVFLFFGIFFTMMPALQYTAQLASSPEFSQYLTPGTTYWATGILSGFLDNAPTYANFLSLGMAKFGMNYSNFTDVHNFAYGIPDEVTYHLLEAISVGAVLFGAFSYIGNGPNFMVKAIAEEAGIKMPTFFKYI